MHLSSHRKVPMGAVLFQISLVSVYALSAVTLLYSDSYDLSSDKKTLPLLRDPNFEIQTVYQGIGFPSAMSFLDANDILVLEKNQGTIKRIVNGTMAGESIFDAEVSYKDERGLLGIAISRNSESEHGPSVRDVFLYYTESSTGADDSNRETLGGRVYKYEFNDNRLTNGELLLAIPVGLGTNIGYHVGGKLILDSDEKLYVAVGDMGHQTETQNIIGEESSGTGVIYRITKEGQTAPGNPIQAEGLLGKFYAYGIRNSFGMDFDPVTGALWDTENGEDHSDEINIVEPGFNSGWSQIQGLSDLDGDFNESALMGYDGAGKYSEPEFVWNNTVGPTAIEFLDSEIYGAEYENDMFVGDVKYGNLYHFELNGERNQLELTGALEDKIANNSEERELPIFGQNFGSIVDMTVSPDGYLYILAITRSDGPMSGLGESDGVGTIYKIVPSEYP